MQALTHVNIPQPHTDTAVVAIDDLHKSYADHHVLKGISMRAKEGEAVSRRSPIRVRSNVCARA